MKSAAISLFPKSSENLNLNEDTRHFMLSIGRKTKTDHLLFVIMCQVIYTYIKLIQKSEIRFRNQITFINGISDNCKYKLILPA